MIYAGNVTRDGWGNLSGPPFKAASTRAAAPFFRELVGNFCTSHHGKDRSLNEVVVALDELCDVLYSAPMFPTLSLLWITCATFASTSAWSISACVSFRDVLVSFPSP